MSVFKYVSAILICIFSFTAYAKNAEVAANAMVPPQPLNNPVYENMVGTWSGESDMMGEKTKDTVKISWTLNHQFILLELKSQGINNSKLQYEGMGIFGVDEKGQAKTWWYDSWGASAIATGSGRFEGNSLVIKDSNGMFKEVRTFNVNGNEMSMTAKGSMKTNGKDQPFEQKVLYKKVS